jgi:transposase
MNPYPGKHSVIIMDNAHIHHDAELIETIEALGCKVIFLPPYSPDYNPIETAFSTVKLWIKRHQEFMESCNDPIYALHAACAHITTEMAKSFFKSSIYCDM